MLKFRWIVPILALAATVAGCCTLPTPPLPVDYSNPLKRVAILPMKNDTDDVDGPSVLREKMAKALVHRSYAVQDLKETEQTLRDRMGINLGGQLDMTTAQKLGETLGVEGVLYGTLMDFDETTTGVLNVKKVRAKFKLVNTGTGQVFWQRGLGVRSEVKMAGLGAALATAASRAADKDKEAPWVILDTTTQNQDFRTSLAMGLGTKLLSKAMGKHLDHESEELARRVTGDLPWGPGTGPAPAPAPAIKIAMPEIKAPPSFGYMDWEGKRDLMAKVVSTSVDKSRNSTYVFESQLGLAGNKMRMDMDMSKMMNDETGQSPMSKMTMLNRGDKKTGYTLYPNAKKYIVHTEAEEQGEKPNVEKVKVGTETVNGYLCDKYKVKITYKDGKSEEGFIWNALKLNGLTVRSEVENKDFKITTDLKSVILKAPPASAFEIPSAYTEAKDFMEIMMSGQQGQMR
ncbi:MAG: DUF799 family lipoprotein [Nitrospirota bacterium]|nr:DUF799 family lipoprotein [Nitrospirota bacterium]